MGGRDGGYWHGSLSEHALNSLVVALTEVAKVVAAAALPNAQPSEDSPIPFELGDLMPMVDQLARGRDVSQFEAESVAFELYDPLKELRVARDQSLSDRRFPNPGLPNKNRVIFGSPR